MQNELRFITMDKLASTQEKSIREELPYNLSFFWFVIASAFVALMGEDIAFLQGYGVHFDFWGFYLVAFSAFALCLSYLVFAHCCFRVKIHWWFLALFLVLAVGNAIGLLNFPSTLDSQGYQTMNQVYVDVHYHLETANRIRYLVSFSITCFYFYILWAIAPKCLKNDRVCDVFLVAGILLSLAAIVFSWVAEWGMYESYFTKGDYTSFSDSPMSFTGNPNTFASVLLYGIVSTWVLQARRHCWVNYLLAFIFNVQILLVFSKTCLIILAVFWPIYIVYRYLATVKAHPVRSSILLGVIVVGTAGLITTWWAISHAWPESIFGKYWFYTIKLFQSDDAFTLFIRINDCNRLFSAFPGPISYVFGLGSVNAEWFLGALLNTPDGCVGYTHNGVIYQFASGGALRTLVYLIILAYAFYAFVKAMSRRQKTAIPLFLGFLLMLCHGFTETTSFLDVNTKGVLGVLTLIYPVLIPMAKSPIVVKAKSTSPTSRIYTLSCFYWLSPFLAFGSILPLFARAFGFSEPLPLALCLVCLILFLIVPLTVNLAKKESFGKYYLPPFFVSLIVYTSFFALSFLLPLQQSLSEVALLCLAFCSACFLIMSLPPLARRSCPGLLRFISGFEKFTTRFRAFFIERNDRREGRYYARKRRAKAREALHY